MTSASEQGKPKGEEPKKRPPGRPEDRVAITPKQAGELLDRFLGKKPKPREGGDGDEPERPKK